MIWLVYNINKRGDLKTEANLNTYLKKRISMKKVCFKCTVNFAKQERTQNSLATFHLSIVKFGF